MFNAIGAHIYAGGFTLGVSKHFHVLAHLEHAAYGADVVKLNFPDLPIYAGGPEKWPRSWPKGADRPRFMFANPPCAIWSGASHGRAGRWQDDPRLAMHHDIFNYALDEVGVDVLAIESVPPSFVRGREHVDILIDKASTRGYASTIAMHNAMYLGVPQNRSRIFYVFHKVAIPWMHPPFEEPMTVRQALKGVRPPKDGYDTSMSDKYATWARLAKPGEGLAHVFDRHNPDPPRGDRGQVIGRPAFLDTRLPWDKPAGVIIGGKAIHPEETRFVNRNEAAALCGFPQTYKWPRANFNDITCFMSRGVVPAAAEWLAENVFRALTENRRVNEPLSEVIDVRRPPGDRYELQPVTSYVVSVADSHLRGDVVLSTPSVARRDTPAPRGSTVIVDWAPRLCGSTAWGGHLRGADPDIELLSFSKSGNPIKTWESAFDWKARRIADAAAILNDYDRVILADVACFAPDVTKDDSGRPYYEAVMAKVTRSFTAVFHGGTYPMKHDDTIDAVLSSPGFTGTLVTPRIGQARSRLEKWPSLRFEHHPYLPYDISQERRGPRGRERSVMMTARLMSNKGQNAALALADHVNGNTEIWGYNAFGFPSIAWGLYELGTRGLGYTGLAPILRADKSTLTHPNAPKFYTGKFELQTPRGRRFRYHDGYRTLDEIDWSPWLHLSLASPDFAGILEYTILDAVFSGAIAVVPESFPTEGRYETIRTFPFNGSTIAWDDNRKAIRETRAFDRNAVASVVNGLLKLPNSKLSEIADAQYAEFTELHRPERTLAAVDRALKGGSQVARKQVIVASAPPFEVLAPDREEGEKSGAYIRRLLQAGIATDSIIAAVHAQFLGSKAGPSDVAWNRGKLRKEGVELAVLAKESTEAKRNGKEPTVVAPRHDVKILSDEGRKSVKYITGLGNKEPPTYHGHLVEIGQSLEKIGRVLASLGGKP